MGFEPRAAERLRLVFASSIGAFDDVTHLLAKPGEGEMEASTEPARARAAEPASPRSRRRSPAS
jgi:hypothetical protein